ncbi:MAG TPA: hypothetical protein VGP58_02615, partial [Pyrinomonadaceae bacterium]|nr:hypothetical protein [Pyrinomonadaceae bacterium]
LENPSDEFVKLVASKVFNGVMTPNRREYFSGIAKRAFRHLINEQIDLRLKSAMSETANVENNSVPIESEKDMNQVNELNRENLVETTKEELEGFYIVKSLLRDIVDPNRITHRDTQSYMGILLDDNNRKPLARLHLNRGQKYLGIFDEKRKEERVPIQNLDEIYQHAEKMRRVFAFYESENNASQ